MSIARAPIKQGPEIKRERFFRQTRIKKVFESVKDKSLEYAAAFCLATTAIGELIGRDYSIKWYLLTSAFYALILVAKVLELKPKDNIIIDGKPTDQQPPK